jgi:hypothetical protein
VTPGSVQASNGNTLVPDGSELYELAPDGAARRLWAAHDDVIYGLAWTADGVLAATGNRGRIYRVEENGEFADIAHLDAAQAAGLAPAPEGWYVGTGNGGRLYHLGAAPAEGSLESDVQDAGAVALWGRAEIDSSGPAGRLYARSGNVSNAARGWGAWAPVTPETANAAPTARFAQWKLTLKPGTRVAAVSLSYLPVNVAPVVDEVVVVPGARITPQSNFQPPVQTVAINLPSAAAGVVNLQQDPNTAPIQAAKDKGAVTVRWAAHDDNGDDLVFGRYYRGAGEQNWQLLKDSLSDRFYSFDAAQLPDGPYQIRVVASDAPATDPGRALTGERTSERFVIATATPAVRSLAARLESGRVHVIADAVSNGAPIAHAEFSIDAGPWQYIGPVGRISDSPAEHYDFTVPLPAPSPATAAAGLPPASPGEHVLTLRVYDRYDNTGLAKAVLR